MKNKELLEWLLGDDTGLSSKHLVGHMLGIPIREYAPLDADDRGRCLRVLKIMGEEWVMRLPEMNKYEGWAEQVEIMLKELE
jgi:hypothetical protein